MGSSGDALSCAFYIWLMTSSGSDIQGSQHTQCTFSASSWGATKPVSVATGNQEFHPFYGSPGVISNIACRGHGSGVLPYAMLPIPKGLMVYSISCKLCSQRCQWPSDINKVQNLRSSHRDYIMNVSLSFSHYWRRAWWLLSPWNVQMDTIDV
jgi:hypothetical protein